MRNAVVVIVMMLLARLAAAGPGNAPPGVDQIPPLSSDGGKPFVVDGVLRTAAADGFGFHFATDGKRQLCAIFDPHDGTPLYLSDGQQTLLYDLSGDRVVRVPASRAYVSVDWIQKEDRPLRFSTGVDFANNAKKPPDRQSFFRVDRFVASSKDTLKPAEPSVKGAKLFAAQRKDGSVESVQVANGRLDSFRFTSRRPDQAHDFLDLTARLDAVPENAIRFPDLAALRRDVTVVDFDEKLMPELVSFLKSGYGSVAKMAIAGGEDIHVFADKILLSPNWGELRKRDAKLGEAYRTGLSKQDVQYRPAAAATDKPSTRPSR